MESSLQLNLLTENDAWDLLSRLLSGEIPDKILDVEIGEWAEIHLKFKGEKYSSTITPSMMEAFLDLQKNIHRLYAKLKYNDSRSNILTDDEKRSVDILVKVSEGSTDAKIDLKEVLKQLVEGAINKMEAKHYMVLALIAGLTYATPSMWKSYLQQQNDLKNADVKVHLSKEETRRLEIVAQATSQVPHTATVILDADEFRNKVLKSAKAADSMEVAGQEITKDQATKLVRASRSSSKDVRLDGEYRIVKVDSSNADHFKVFLVGLDGKGFPAVLDDQTITKAQNRKLLQEAEWDKKTINLMINGTTVRGEVTSARIIDVKERFSPAL